MKFKYLLAMMAFIPASLIASVSYATGAITSISVPSPAYVNTSISVTVNGTGSCTSGYTIYWGDGGNTPVPGTVSLPHSPSHTYTTTGLKTMSIDAGEDTDCSGGPTKQIQITTKPSGGVGGVGLVIIRKNRISSMIGADKAYTGKLYKIKVYGSGKCNLRVHWGDGKSTVYKNYSLHSKLYPATSLLHRYLTVQQATIAVVPEKTISKYGITKIAYNPCTGIAGKRVRVGVRFFPWKKKTPTGKIPARRIPTRR